MYYTGQWSYTLDECRDFIKGSATIQDGVHPRDIEYLDNCLRKLCPRHAPLRGRHVSQPLSAVVRSTSPTVKYLQGMRTAPRPIRHSRSSARELARSRLVRPTVLPIRLSPETDIVGDRSQTLRLLVVAQYLRTRAWLASCGVLLTALACGRARLQPRGIASALLYYSRSIRILCAAGALRPWCVWKPLRSCDSSACRKPAHETRQDTTYDYGQLRYGSLRAHYETTSSSS